MRDLIRFAASVFVAMGAIVFFVCAVLSAGVLTNQDPIGGIFGVMIAFGGLVSGASVILVGGSAYLLAAIDQRLEGALRKSGLDTPGSQLSGATIADELGAAQVG